jgi:hypothetical protein
VELVVALINLVAPGDGGTLTHDVKRDNRDCQVMCRVGESDVSVLREQKRVDERGRGGSVFRIKCVWPTSASRELN